MFLKEPEKMALISQINLAVRPPGREFPFITGLISYWLFAFFHISSWFSQEGKYVSMEFIHFFQILPRVDMQLFVVLS